MARNFAALSSFFIFVLCGGWLHYPTVATQEFGCRGLRFVRPVDGFALQHHVIKEIYLLMRIELNGDCRHMCLMESACVSVNVGSPDKDGFRLCQLSDSDHIKHPEDLKPRKGFLYLATENPCSSNPCLNNATCLDGFTDKRYICLCQVGYTGENCEKGMKIPSNIIGGNDFLFSHLSRFLKPVAGSHSNWKLCYRASSHGWAASTFHNRCDGKPHTVTIIRKSPYVFGGYTDIAWASSGGYGSTSNAFIFSLINKEGLAPFKSMVKSPIFAIYMGSSLGPIFGGGADIYISNKANSNTGSHTNFGHSYSVPSGVQDRYTILAGTNIFKPDEVEVFYLG